MTGRDRKILALVAVLGVLVGAWVLMIQPRRDQANKLQAQVSANQATLATARAQVVAGQAAMASFARDSAAVIKLGEAVPPDEQIPSLIYQLQNAASATGIDFRLLKLGSTSGGAAKSTPPPTGGAGQAQTQPLPPGATVGPAGFPVLPFTFTFQGNFFRLADFFARVQRFVVASGKDVSVSGRLMSLDAISFDAGPGGFPQITATVSATTYLLPSTGGSPSSGAPTSASPQTAPNPASASQAGPSTPPTAAAAP